jgi:hypothetical protein
VRSGNLSTRPRLPADSCGLAQLRKRDKPVSFAYAWKFASVVLSQQACRFQIRRNLNPNPQKSQFPIPSPRFSAARSDKEADATLYQDCREGKALTSKPAGSLSTARRLSRPCPPQQPAYRQNRTHEYFLTNLELPSHKIKEVLKQSWSAAEEFKNIPVETIERLTRERYSRDEWTFKF